jgi:hypothetical protein
MSTPIGPTLAEHEPSGAVMGEPVVPVDPTNFGFETSCAGPEVQVVQRR